MSKSQIKKEPLFYINQPTTIKPPNVNMQEVFSAKKAKELKKQMEKKRALEKKKQIQKEMKTEASRIEGKKVKKRKPFYLDDLKEETGIFGGAHKKKDDVEAKSDELSGSRDETNEQEQKQSTTGQEPSGSYFQKVKSFREMNTIERLDYLDNFPKQLPPVPCLFQTEDKAIRGYLNGKIEDEIEVLLFDKSLKTLPVKDLITVRMLGLN